MLPTAVFGCDYKDAGGARDEHDAANLEVGDMALTVPPVGPGPPNFTDSMFRNVNDRHKFHAHKESIPFAPTPDTHLDDHEAFVHEPFTVNISLSLQSKVLIQR